jgi:hypothetical protein
LQVHFSGETAWLSQNQTAELFQTTKQNVCLPMKNIFAEKKLGGETVVKESLTTTFEQPVPELGSNARSSTGLAGGAEFLQQLVEKIPSG